MIEITEEIAEDLLSFIKNRKNIPIDVEKSIVERQKLFFKKQIIGRNIYHKAYDKFKEILEEKYNSFLLQPGETVGIICGQCIGEKTTQSSLNNFHSAGLDTGSTSQIDHLQNIINASKVNKKRIRNFFKVSLFLTDQTLSLKDVKHKTAQYLEEIKFSDLIINYEYKNITCDIHEIFKSGLKTFDYCVKLSFSLEKLFAYKITRKQILQKLPCEQIACIPYSMLDKNATTLDVFCGITIDDNNKSVFDFFKKTRDTIVAGIEGVKSHIFCQTQTGEWYIDCLCNSISIFFPYNDIYDISRISCNSVNDMNSHFGILTSQQLILEKCKEIIPGIDESHFKILAVRMTKNGFIEPLTRYTMRNSNSPLSKASFEESFETFIKACKFNEKEKFKSISSAIICGKKPKIGTYQCDILIDKSFYIRD